jgi:predicted nucleic acid-binding Zn ribbon protein
MPCAKRFVKERSIKDIDPGYNCEICNKQMVRVFSNLGAIYNGIRIYSTDHR